MAGAGQSERSLLRRGLIKYRLRIFTHRSALATLFFLHIERTVRRQGGETENPGPLSMQREEEMLDLQCGLTILCLGTKLSHADAHLA